ncbi:MAG: hypothetical protein J6S36_07385 [Eggerthellaceae bacterium]|nr:hypothetical protein [Eggerthellaceae bacterium]
MADKIKVIVIGTGNVAGIAIRCLKGREDMELVGVWAHAETAGDLIGTDSGLLDLDEPNGVLITGDIEELYALKPDAAVMAINIRDMYKADAINAEWYGKLLAHGINVVSPSVSGLFWPKRYPAPQLVEGLEAACAAGNASLYMNGQEPGYAENQAMLLSTCSNTIKCLTITEMYNYSTNKNAMEMVPSFGFGLDEDDDCMLQVPEIQYAVWGSTIQHIADEFGVELEGMTASYEKRCTDHDIEVGFGTIDAGTVAAVRIRTAGIVDGREAIVIEHVNRMEQDIAKDWPWTDRVGQIHVEIEGDPNLQVDMNVGNPALPEELSYDGYVLTAMRLVNAIPYVVAAKPGIRTVQEIPMTLPRSAFRSDATFIEHKICNS